jgi:hypothetical protein
MHVIGSYIAVVDVVGMLPHINAYERNESSGRLQGILIGASGNLQAIVGRVESEPAPAAMMIGEMQKEVNDEEMMRYLEYNSL